MSVGVTPTDPGVRCSTPSFVQERLWFQTQRDLDGASYNLCTAHRLRGPLDRAALTTAIEAVVRRHDSLRMRFVAEGGRPRVEVREHVTTPLELVSAPGASDAALRDIVDEIARRPFDLSVRPLARIVLVALGPQDHALVIALHHTIGDGWSIGVLYDELADHYGAHIQGIRLVDQMPPASFASHAERERRRFDEGQLDAAIEHWRARLDGAPRDGLAAAASRPAMQSFRGARARSQLEAPLVASMERFARSERCSLFAVLLALWSGLLSRYGAGEDLVIGTPVAHRSDRDARDVIGSFANTVAIRCDLGGQPTLRELVARTREGLLADQPHFDAPFERVVEALHATRSSDANVVFQHMLVLLNVPTTSLTFPGVLVEELPVESGSCQYDLSLDVKRVGGGLDLTLEYATDLYDESMASQMLAHFGALVEALVADPGTALSSIPLADPTFGVASAAEEDAHADDALTGHRLHELFEQHVAATPNAVAVTCGDEQLTYAELAERAAALAERLGRLGVGPERCVAVLLERSVDIAVALIGISASGGAFVPVDPSWPGPRRELILDETRAVAAVTRRCEDGEHRLEVEPRDLGGRAEEPTPGVSDRNLAHVFYTSGSTGRPKGVAVEHRSIVNRVAWAAGAYRIDQQDCVLVNSPFTFDPFVWELFSPLLVGGRAVITAPGTAEHPGALVQTIIEHEVTVAEFVPSVLARVLDEPRVSECTTLRAVLCGSEAMPAILPNRFHNVLAADLYNVYGPTETSIDSTYWRCERDAPVGQTPIGRPIAHTTVHVLDDHLNPAPIGVPGEIYIGGIGVARGYIDRPEETAARFIPDPYGTEPNSRLFRTGDLGRRRADGALEFVGRVDDQLSVNGVRVEPGEIEHALCTYPGLSEAAVVAVTRARADGMESTQLVAFVTATTTPDLAALRDHVLDRLPRSFVPTGIHMLESLPLDRNGKVDRRSLVDLARASRGGEETKVAPRTPKERALHEIWQAVLGDLDFGVTDDFYELGGDSILTLQVLTMAREAGISLSTRDVTRAQTIEELARAASDEPTAPTRPSRTSAALAPAQAWFFDQEFAHPEHFNDAVLLRLEPSCDLPRLLRALEQVVASHPELGLRFSTRGAQHGQEFGATTPRISFREVDLRSESSRRRDEMRASAAAAAHSSLDPAAGKLASGAVFVSDRRRNLLLILHHLVADAVSWRVLLHEVSLAYDGRMPHAVGGAQLLDWVEELRSRTARGQFDADIDRWLAQKGPSLPRDSAGTNLVADAGVIRSSLSRETTSAILQAAPAAFGAPVGAVLVSALVHAVQSWIGAEEVVLAMEAHGRDTDAGPDLDLLDGIGWFTSLYPARVAVSRGATPVEALEVVRGQLERIPSRGASYGWLRHHHPDPGVRGRLAEVPEPELLFNYAGQFDHVNRSNTVFRQLPYAPGPLQASQARRSHLIEINSFVLDGRFHHEWTYGTGVHDPSTIRALICAMETRIEAIGAASREVGR